MAALGCTLLEVSKHLRHSSIQQTADTYSHLFPDAKRAAAKRLDAIFDQHVEVLRPKLSNELSNGSGRDGRENAV